MFSGLTDVTYETIDLKKSTDSKITLDFENLNGDKITNVPVIYTNTTGIWGGDKQGYELQLNASRRDGGILKNQYFILNTADPKTAANTGNARSYVVQYKGADKATDTSPKVKFDVLGVGTKEITLAASGTSSLKLGGGTFEFTNISTCASDDAPMRLTTADYATGSINASVSAYLRTKNNVLINITDLNTNVTTGAATEAAGVASNWVVKATLDDTNKDGDKYSLSTAKNIFTMTYNNNTDGEFGTTLSSAAGGETGSWISDPDDSTHSTWIDTYGTEIDFTNPSSAPDSVSLKVPDSIVEPKVYVTSGAVTVAAGTTTAGGLAPIVDDSKIATVQDKNLVVVGGSCINKVAAKLLGSDSPLCGADFTAKTNVGAGNYIIDTFASPYTAGKVAMLVAGYEGTDTVAAAQKVVDDKLSPDVATAPIIGPVIA